MYRMKWKLIATILLIVIVSLNISCGSRNITIILQDAMVII